MRAFKRLFEFTSPDPLIRMFRNREHYLDRNDELVYIHIGKCGGTSLWDAINRSTHLKSSFNHISHVHVTKPPILRNSRYLFVVRNPISRAMSAFNWRYKLVVEDKIQKTRFKGEYDVLLKYGTLNTLALALYSDGKLNKNVAKDFHAIHHLKEDISFYLTDLLGNISPSQIYAVLTTENLNQDIKEYLHVDTVKKIHENQPTTNGNKMHLSQLAKSNLRSFLDSDYVAIETLLSQMPVTKEKREALLSF